MSAAAHFIQVPCSPEQEDVIAESLLYGKELGMVPDERAWILNHVNRKFPNSRVLNADLMIEDAAWYVEFSQV